MAHTTTLKGSSWLAKAWQWLPDIGNPLDALVRSSRRQRQLDELSRLDDHLLEDIGLTRGDVMGYTGPSRDEINDKLCNLR